MRPIDVVIGMDSSAATAGREIDIALKTSLLVERLRSQGPLWLTSFEFHCAPAGYTQIINHNHILIEDAPDFAIEAPTICHDSGIVLWDAIGYNFGLMDRHLRGAAARNNSHRAVFLYVTHGGENDSRQFTAEEIRYKIRDAWNRWQWATYIVGLSAMAIDDARLIGAQLCNLDGMEAAVGFTRRAPHPNP